MQQDLLSDLETRLVKAHSGKRMLNYVIDSIFCGFILGIVLALVNLVPDFSPFGALGIIIDRLFYLFLFGIFIGIIEAVFKGKTLGKLITKTKCVNQDGSTIDAKTALTRGLIRAIPFEQFSALSGSGAPNPWHDKWTNTLVIDLKESDILTNN